MLMNSGRGGSRPGSGRPAKYSTTDVITIKVPRSLRDDIEAVAHLLDEGQSVVVLSEILKGVKTYKLHGKEVVRISDIENAVSLGVGSVVLSSAWRDSARSEAKTLDGTERP